MKAVDYKIKNEIVCIKSVKFLCTFHVSCIGGRVDSDHTCCVFCVAAVLESKRGAIPMVERRMNDDTRFARAPVYTKTFMTALQYHTA